MNERTKQDGSVVTFVIVGVVLAAVVAGGVYLVNQRDKQAPSSQAPSSSQTSTPSPEQAAPSNNSNSQQQSSSSSSSTGSGASSAVGSTQNRLPTTGPVEDSFRLLFVGVLVGVGTAYVRSRQQRRQAFSL